MSWGYVIIGLSFLFTWVMIVVLLVAVSQLQKSMLSFLDNSIVRLEKEIKARSKEAS